MSTGSKNVMETADSRGKWRQTATVGLMVVVAELFLLMAYATQPGTRITDPWPMVFPLVWIDVSVFVLVRGWQSHPSGMTTRRRWTARLLSAGYFLILGHFGGLYGVVRDRSGSHR